MSRDVHHARDGGDQLSQLGMVMHGAGEMEYVRLGALAPIDSPAWTSHQNQLVHALELTKILEPLTVSIVSSSSSGKTYRR